MKTATAIFTWVDRRLARHDKILDRLASWMWGGFLAVLVLCALAGCQATGTRKITFEIFGSTLSYEDAAANYSTGFDAEWLRYRDKQAERESRLDDEVMGPILEPDDEQPTP